MREQENRMSEGETKAKKPQKSSAAPGEKPRKEAQPQEPRPPLYLWQEGSFVQVGEGQMVPGPLEATGRGADKAPAPTQNPIGGKLRIEGEFTLPSDLINNRGVVKIGDLALDVYLLSTSKTGGKNGDVANFIVMRKLGAG